MRPARDGATSCSPAARPGCAYPIRTGVAERGTWTSPPVRLGFAVAEVVPSWTADTPDGCWIQVDLRGWHDDAPSTDWYRLARWAADDRRRTPHLAARTA